MWRGSCGLDPRREGLLPRPFPQGATAGAGADCRNGRADGESGWGLVSTRGSTVWLHPRLARDPGWIWPGAAPFGDPCEPHGNPIATLDTVMGAGRIEDISVARKQGDRILLPGFEDVPVGATGRPKKEFAEPVALRSHGPARIISLCNQKGGVGKTTTTINLGAALAAYGRRVLAIDFDPQGALSAGLGVPTHDVTTIYDLLLSGSVNPTDAIQKTSVENLDIIPANIDLSAAEVHLVNEVAREQILARVLRKVSGDYDVILIDCQPSLGILTVNALTASHGVLIPLECEFFALRGVALLIETIDKVRDRLNPAIELDGILATMYDSRTLHSREVLERVVDAFGDSVLETVIGRTVKFPDASVAGVPITEFAPEHAAAKAYKQAARELIQRGAVA
jgi:chromosome partitioning protein